MKNIVLSVYCLLVGLIGLIAVSYFLGANLGEVIAEEGLRPWMVVVTIYWLFVMGIVPAGLYVLGAVCLEGDLKKSELLLTV